MILIECYNSLTNDESTNFVEKKSAKIIILAPKILELSDSKIRDISFQYLTYSYHHKRE